MRIDWKPDTRADAAERIAYHTQEVIAALDAATTAPQVRQIFDDWARFAREHRVCAAIVDHMVAKRKALVGDFEKPRPKQAATTDLSRRMVGDRDE